MIQKHDFGRNAAEKRDGANQILNVNDCDVLLGGMTNCHLDQLRTRHDCRRDLVLNAAEEWDTLDDVLRPRQRHVRLERRRQGADDLRLVDALLIGPLIFHEHGQPPL